MIRWRYRITIHTVPDILERVAEPAEAPPQIFCDDRGQCYFDAAPNPLTDAIESLLNQVGEESWELVQIAFRPHQMVAFWKQPVSEA